MTTMSTDDTPAGHAIRATMRDVAALAGVSLKTVSRVVNREAGVSDDLREKVERAVERLDYTHNLTASNLRRSHGRTGVVGALVQDVSNSFSVALLRSLEDAARERHCVVLAASIDEETERERSLVADLVARRVDGLILMPSTADQSYLASEVRAGLPTVFVDRPPRGVVADAVLVDNRRGAREGVKHLVAAGHRRVAALVDLTSIPTAADRMQGYYAALRAAGIKPDPRLVLTGLRTAEEAQAALTDLMTAADPPTAVFSCRNILSVGAIRALRSLGLSHRVALVGFDDFPLADLMNPPLTVVRQDVKTIGRRAAELLFARIEGDRSPPQQLLSTPVLIPRGSGEIRPFDVAAHRQRSR
jgi:LacI family transcriptional regulator